MRIPLGFIGGLASNGMAFLLTVMPASPSAFSASLAEHAFGEYVDQHEVRVGSAGDDAEAFGSQGFRQNFGVGDDLPRVLAEFRLHRFLEADGFGGDDVNQRPALHSGKHNLVDGCAEFLLATGSCRREARAGSCGWWW